jgi:predicted dehydrogenase
LKVRVGVIGLGAQGKVHLSKYANLSDQAEIVAVSDVIASMAEQMAKKFGAKVWYTDYKELIKRTDIDAVSICVPNSLHADVAVASAEAGKHILLEKPMAVSLDDADKILRAVEKNDVKLMLGYNQVFNPMVQRVKKDVADGRLGRVSIIKSQYVRNLTATSRESFGWRADVSQAGGGVITESGVHRLSLSWYLGGEVKEVSCFTERLEMDIDAEDNAAILLKYENGGIGVVICSWVAEFKGPEWEKIEVYGSKGSRIGYGDSRSGVAYLELSDIGMPEYGRIHSYFPPQAIFKGGFDTFNDEFKHFLDCIQRDQKPIVDGHAGKAILEITLAAYESAKHKRAVDLPLS